MSAIELPHEDAVAEDDTVRSHIITGTDYAMAFIQDYQNTYNNIYYTKVLANLYSTGEHGNSRNHECQIC